MSQDSAPQPAACNRCPLPANYSVQPLSAGDGRDEKISVNAMNGTVDLMVPLPFTPAIEGFTPALALCYNSGQGNSVFGLGWGLGLTAIRRKSNKRRPLYDDISESDVFVLEGAGELVPRLNEYGDEDEYITAAGLLVKHYRPRVEGLFACIAFIKNQQGHTWWRITASDHITTWYGLSAGARLARPDVPGDVFKWLPELVTDNKGNVHHYLYKQENLENVPDALHERNRINGQALFNNIYLKRIRYCNRLPYDVSEADLYIPRLPDNTTDFRAEMVLDYGEHNDASGVPVAVPVSPWAVRPDPFSGFDAGFELRTYRRCQRLLMFHRSAEQAGTAGRAVPVWSMTLSYQHGTTDTYTDAGFITEIVQINYEQTGDTWQQRSLPPVKMDYQLPDVGTEGNPYIRLQNRMDQPATEDGCFTPSIAGEQTFRFDLAHGAMRCKEVYFHPYNRSFFEPDAEQQKEVHPAKNKLNTDWRSPYTKMLDLTGDGRPDLLMASDHISARYERNGGDVAAGPVTAFFDEVQGYGLLWSDQLQSIWYADMNGDGITDLVRISQREVCYWPYMGHGQFAPKVSMTGVPVVDDPVSINPLHLQLADITGSGTADLVALSGDTCHVWINCSGNAFGKACDITVLPDARPDNKIPFSGFSDNGTGCIVRSHPLAPQPYLMAAFHNGRGKSVAITYGIYHVCVPDDHAAEYACRRRLPVPCIDRIKTTDTIRETCHIQTYTYRHGCYDDEERVFRGFGRADVLETGSTTDRKDDGRGQQIFTKTWYHTGAWIRGKTLADVFKQEYCRSGDRSEPEPQVIFPSILNPQEQRDACGALKGAVLRQEVYRYNGIAPHSHPHRVTTNSFRIKTVQYKWKNQHASFLICNDQILRYRCGHDPADTELSHTLVLSVDEYGNVLETVEVLYPQKDTFRSAPSDKGMPVRTEHGKMKMVFSMHAFTHDTGAGLSASGPAGRRVPCTGNSYELSFPEKYYPGEGMLWTVAELTQLIPAKNTAFDFSGECAA